VSQTAAVALALAAARRAGPGARRWLV